jgi:hypothetical protein
MTSNETTNFDWIPQKADKPKHFRKGDIGDWRNHFTAEQSLQMNEFVTVEALSMLMAAKRAY